MDYDYGMMCICLDFMFTQWIFLINFVMQKCWSTRIGSFNRLESSFKYKLWFSASNISIFKFWLLNYIQSMMISLALSLRISTVYSHHDHDLTRFCISCMKMEQNMSNILNCNRFIKTLWNNIDFYFLHNFVFNMNDIIVFQQKIISYWSINSHGYIKIWYKQQKWLPIELETISNLPIRIIKSVYLKKKNETIRLKKIIQSK